MNALCQTIKSARIILGAIAVLSLPAMASADEIMLTSVDETVSFRGEFVGFAQDTYVIRYNGYELRIPARDMNCDGNDCLQIGSQPAVTLASNG